MYVKSKFIIKIDLSKNVYNDIVSKHNDRINKRLKYLDELEKSR